MKLTFEGQSMLEIVTAMKYVVADYHQLLQLRGKDPSPEPVPVDVVPVDKPVDKPVEEKPFARKMREAKAAKAAKPVTESLATESLATESLATESLATEPVKPPPDVSEIIKLRQRTINDLQEAYANGRQKEVFELLSRFGNGAKSFRELTADAFVPIREAIDNGALA